MSRYVILSDLHFPEEHRQGWPFFLSILPELNVDGIYILGDGIENVSLGRFRTHPRERLLLKPHLAQAHKQFLLLRKAHNDKQIIYLEGNHEERLQNYICDHAQSLIDLDETTTPTLLKLKSLDIQWKPRGSSPLRLGKLNLIHGDEIKASGLFPARTIYLKVGANVICGHHHRLDRYLHRLMGGEMHGVWVNPCLRTLNPTWQFFPQWHLGFSIVSVARSGTFHVDQVPFFGHGASLSCMIDGRVFSSTRKKNHVDLL